MANAAQIQLTEAQASALAERARAEGRSVADLVSASIAEYLDRPSSQAKADLVRQARALFGRYHSKLPDLAEKHDAYLADAFDD